MKKNIVLIAAGLFIISWQFAYSTDSNFNDYINARDDEQKSVPKFTVPAQPDSDEHQTHSDDPDPSAFLPPDWKKCMIDSDCTAAVTDCVSWRGINKNHVKDIAANLKSCTAAVDPGFQPQSACVHHQCQTTDQITHVSWEEWLNQVK